MSTILVLMPIEPEVRGRERTPASLDPSASKCNETCTATKETEGQRDREESEHTQPALRFLRRVSGFFLGDLVGLRVVKAVIREGDN
jgi:hypothetical protein